MSGVVKGIKKTFKKVVDVTKKIAKPVMIGAAIYFTAGMALGAFPATAGFAANMPGFAGGGLGGLGIGAGKSAGTGLFSKMATGLGMGGGIQANTLSEVTRTAAGSGGGMGELVSKGASLVAQKGGGGMQLADKLLLAKAGTDFLGGLMAPSEKSIIREQKKWHGAFGGVDSGGQAAGPAPMNPYAQRQVAPVAAAGEAPAPQVQKAPQLQAPQRQAPLLDVNRGRRYVA